MATATKTATEGVVTEMIRLTDIASNTAQSRGMGVLSRLEELGYGLFKSPTEDKDSIWAMLISDKPEVQKAVVTLLEENEPEVAKLAAGLRTTGQLQPIGVWQMSAGYDVIFGMRRTLAQAFNWAKFGSNDYSEIEAKVFSGKMSPVDLKLMALEENADREEESPIDKALTYQWLQKEGKLTPKQIGERIGYSDQHVRNHTKLLDKLLEDKRLAIHNGSLSVDAALKLLVKRKEDQSADTEERESTNGEERHRLPTVKGIIKIYEAGAKPEGMKQKEWELWIDPQVRRFLAYKLGLKYKEWEPKAEPVKEPKVEEGEATTNGEAPKKKKVLKVKKERAIQLLMSLGKTNARTFTNENLASKLESIVNIMEDGAKAETDSLQKLLDTLVAGYKDGLKVEIVE